MAKLKVKEPVKLRSRMTSKGLQSLFLDVYINGNRKQEYLNLYLYPEDSREAKAKNKETLMFAEAVRAKRVIEVRNRKYDFEDESGNVYFIDWLEAMAEKRKEGTRKVWMAVVEKMRGYARKKLLLSEIDAKWMAECRDHLIAETSTNTALTYFSLVKACLNEAYKKGLITRLPYIGLDPVKGEDVEKEYLTIKELKRLVATPAKYEDLARAFIFSCLTGLRLSDILKLKWKEVSKDSSMPRITFTQKKTSSLEYLDITPQAMAYMGERGRPEDAIFAVKNICLRSERLQEWAKSAGIDKNITFHSGRHTFAIMMLELGTDIYTVQKLLGHSSIETTMVYAKILDKSKQQAVLKIPDLSKK